MGAVVMTGMISQSKETTNEPIAIASCVDFDPPSTTDTVTLSTGQTYGLIKDNAEVIEKSKFQELEFVEIVSGKNAYALPRNIYGETISTDIIFILQNTVPFKSPYVFKIYIRDGIPIPPEIINCKSTGGRIAVSRDNTSFPPSAFNKTDIVNLTDFSISPGYIYSGAPKTTYAFVKNLPGVMIGSLSIASKGTNLPLYFHSGIMYLIDNNDAYEYLGSNEPISLSQSKKSLQLQKITFVTTPTYSWYTPSCKPAIYLYPTKKEAINVKVNTIGIFTLTIPDYPKNGWNVIAHPNGDIESDDKIFEYLYYESMIPDARVVIPDKGYVVADGELSDLFNQILPRVGLNRNEASGFSDYWLKALPSSPYYFVGLMNEKSINDIEPLVINPTPDTINRVRFYFELLDKPKIVEKPIITTPERKGFTVIEWGGMVKTDKNNLFTCSQ